MLFRSSRGLRRGRRSRSATRPRPFRSRARGRSAGRRGCACGSRPSLPARPSTFRRSRARPAARRRAPAGLRRPFHLLFDRLAALVSHLGRGDDAVTRQAVARLHSLMTVSRLTRLRALSRVGDEVPGPELTIAKMMIAKMSDCCVHSSNHTVVMSEIPFSGLCSGTSRAAPTA